MFSISVTNTGPKEWAYAPGSYKLYYIFKKMFFILIKNYIKALFESIGWVKKIKRIKHSFYFGTHKIYLDMYCSYPRELTINEKDIIKLYETKIENEYKNWNIVIDVMLVSDLVDYKATKDFVEIVILTDRYPHYIASYINYMSIKTIADIRDDKINKLLGNK